jgi:hypothetical protein
MMSNGFHVPVDVDIDGADGSEGVKVRRLTFRMMSSMMSNISVTLGRYWQVFPYYPVYVQIPYRDFYFYFIFY